MAEVIAEHATFQHTSLKLIMQSTPRFCSKDKGWGEYAFRHMCSACAYFVLRHWGKSLGPADHLGLQISVDTLRSHFSIPACSCDHLVCCEFPPVAVFNCTLAESRGNAMCGERRTSRLIMPLVRSTTWTSLLSIVARSRNTFSTVPFRMPVAATLTKDSLKRSRIFEVVTSKSGSDMASRSLASCCRSGQASDAIVFLETQTASKATFSF